MNYQNESNIKKEKCVCTGPSHDKYMIGGAVRFRCGVEWNDVR